MLSIDSPMLKTACIGDFFLENPQFTQQGMGTGYPTLFRAGEGEHTEKEEWHPS